jgi:hypothetical protein
MACRFLASSMALAALLVTPLAAQTSKPQSAKIPRVSDGHPDLQGVWTNATITPMERPAKYASKLTLTDAEAKELEKDAAKELADVDGKSEVRCWLPQVPTALAVTTSCSSIVARSWRAWTASNGLP